MTRRHVRVLPRWYQAHGCRDHGRHAFTYTTPDGLTWNVIECQVCGQTWDEMDTEPPAAEPNPAEFGPHVACTCAHDIYEDHDAPWGCVRCGCQHWPSYGPAARCVCPLGADHEHDLPYGCQGIGCSCRWFPAPVGEAA